jgi:hypothetical protein
MTLAGGRRDIDRSSERLFNKDIAKHWREWQFL